MEKLENLLKQLTVKEAIVGAGSVGIILGLTGGVVFKSQIRKIVSKLGLVDKNKFASINAPTAGARTSAPLKRGKHPIQLHSMGTPNGQKVTILLEELGLKYDAHYVNIMKGDQFTSGFVEINPNSKIPSLVDYTDNSEDGINIYESGNILLYFAEKHGKFIPKDPKKRIECLNLLFFQMGGAPYFGQYGHFHKYAPKGFWFDHEYGINRYKMEVKRQLSVLDNLLKDREYLVGDEYTIADMAWYPWIRCIEHGYNSWDIIEVESYKNVMRWFKAIESRPAVIKGRTVNQPWVTGGDGNFSSE